MRLDQSFLLMSSCGVYITLHYIHGHPISPSLSTTRYDCQTACYSHTRREHQKGIQIVCCPGPKIMEQAPHWHQHSRSRTHLLSQTEISSVQCEHNSEQIVKITSYISFFCVAIEAACVSVKPCVLAWFLFFLVLYLHGWMHFLWDALELCQLNNVISCTNRIHPPSHPRLLAFSLWANCVIMGNMIKLINERHVCVITWIGKCMSGRKQGVISQSYSY